MLIILPYFFGGVNKFNIVLTLHQSKIKQFMKLIYYPMVFLLVFNFNAQETDLEKEKEPTKKFQFSGSVDAYFRQNISGPNGADAISPNTSFADLNGFALGMVNVIASYEGEKVGFVGDLVFGPRGEDATFLSEILRPDGNSSIVNQLFVYWNVNDAITLTFGNFNTFLGYEVISPTANFNYSTSYMFSYGPFSHTGLKADFVIAVDADAVVGRQQQQGAHGQCVPAHRENYREVGIQQAPGKSGTRAQQVEHGITALPHHCQRATADLFFATASSIDLISSAERTGLVRRMSS